jgi:hypothetical protein
MTGQRALEWGFSAAGGRLLCLVERAAAVLLSVVCLAVVDAAVTHIPATSHSSALLAACLNAEEEGALLFPLPFFQHILQAASITSKM